LAAAKVSRKKDSTSSKPARIASTMVARSKPPKLATAQPREVSP
jgi:hypothetical protein